MTNFITEVAEHIIYDFKEYLDFNNITQAEAAELLGISKGQLSHILKMERSLNDLVGRRMLSIIKGARPDSRGGIYGLYYKNNLIYIGKTVNFKNRWYAHKSAIKNQHEDDQPLHQANLDVDFLEYKILFDNSKVHIFPHEMTDIEGIFIINILPEWNTDISTISSLKKDVNEKILEIIKIYNVRKENTLSRLKDNFLAGITEQGNKELINSFSYSKEEILRRAITIIKNSKQYKENIQPITITTEQVF